MNDSISSIGYVPDRRFKVHAAVTNTDIKKIDLSRVQYTYVWGTGDDKFVPCTKVTKRGNGCQIKKTTNTIIYYFYLRIFMYIVCPKSKNAHLGGLLRIKLQ